MEALAFAPEAYAYGYHMKLPLLFNTIIEHDKKDPRHLSKEAHVPIRLPDYKEWRDKRRMLSVSAEAFIVKQRGGTPNA